MVVQREHSYDCFQEICSLVASFTPKISSIFTPIIIIITAFLSVSYATTQYRKRSGKNNLETPPNGVSLFDETPKDRSPGVWNPSSFRWPKPAPFADWSIETTKPLPYRPFKYGPKYFVTMGIRNTNYDEWIEMDNEFPRFYREKAVRISERGQKCCRTLPEAFPAAVELLEELVEYLPSRYPSLYERVDKGIKNLWSGEVIDNTSQPLPEDPMQSVGRLTQDDMAILIERPDGDYYLLAGAILLAGFWRLEDKLGMPLWEIHTSAGVPHYREKLEKSMYKFFRRLKAEDFVTRNNYTLQIDDNLPWSVSVGDEDSNDLGWHHAEQDPPIGKHHLRSERQSLRRLPKSGAIVFGIHTYFSPITELAKEDYVPGRLASAIRSWDETISSYKGTYTYEKVLLKYLDEKHREQIQRGLKLEEEDQRRRYPW
ncbi:unnamed protein product [Clonostachys byssicola]|uniref:Mannosyl transferase n=1 Tax=Clonostachys byssicola TaxID=160290 RepID=A0A9N9UEH5_9HYPO|nr:unnamed protein product [Clonostachys byssicola]